MQEKDIINLAKQAYWMHTRSYGEEAEEKEKIDKIYKEMTTKEKYIFDCAWKEERDRIRKSWQESKRQEQSALWKIIIPIAIIIFIFCMIMAIYSVCNI